MNVLDFVNDIGNCSYLSTVRGIEEERDSQRNKEQIESYLRDLNAAQGRSWCFKFVYSSNLNRNIFLTKFQSNLWSRTKLKKLVDENY